MSPQPTPSDHDIIIIGAGVVGSALAYSLARSGRDVGLLERDVSPPDRIVGELLQPGGVRALRRLGLVSALDDIDAVPVEGYRCFYGPREVPIPYPLETQEQQGRGVPSFSGHVEGRSFHHGNFVGALRKISFAHERVTVYEATVRELLEDAGGRIHGVVATQKEETGDAATAGESSAATTSSSSRTELRLSAPLVIVADGCFSKFRRQYGSSIVPKVRSNFVGLELTHAPLPAPRHGHVVLGPAGPVLLYQIGSTVTRILIDVPGEKLPSQSKGDLQRHIREKVVPQLPERLRATLTEEMDKGQRLRSMPNSFLPPSMQGQSKQRQGVIVVGDAMNMRHPLTGGGMSVGLWDCVHLTSILGGSHFDPSTEDGTRALSTQPVALEDWDAIRPALRAWHWRRKGLSSVINILAQALYSLFGAEDANLEVLREGCFKYFERGGECVGGPVRLLSGLAPSPVLLFYHFFSVAVYSIYCLFAHARVYAGEQAARVPRYVEYPSLVVRSVAVFWTACVVLLPVVFTEMRSNIPRLDTVASATANTLRTSTMRRSKRATLSAHLADHGVFVLMALIVAAWWAYLVPSDSTMVASGGVRPSRWAGYLHDWLVFPRAAAFGGGAR